MSVFDDDTFITSLFHVGTSDYAPLILLTQPLTAPPHNRTIAPPNTIWCLQRSYYFWTAYRRTGICRPMRGSRDAIRIRLVPAQITIKPNINLFRSPDLIHTILTYFLVRSLLLLPFHADYLAMSN